jgi:hypothetical protein
MAAPLSWRQVAPEFDESLLCRCVDAAANLDQEKHQSRVLNALAPRLSGERLTRAVDTASAFADAEAKAAALSTLAQQLSGEQKRKVLKDAMNTALAISSLGARAWALAAVASQLTGADRDCAMTEGLRAAEAIDKPESRAHALTGFLGIAENNMDVIKRIRRVMAEELRARWTEPRERVLSFCAWEDLFCTPMLSEEAGASLLENVMSIRDDWRWLSLGAPGVIVIMPRSMDEGSYRLFMGPRMIPYQGCASSK